MSVCNGLENKNEVFIRKKGAVAANIINEESIAVCLICSELHCEKNTDVLWAGLGLTQAPYC